MNYPLNIDQKNHIYKQYKTTLEGTRPDEKLKLWFDSLMRIPFGVYKGVNFESIKPKKIKKTRSFVFDNDKNTQSLYNSIFEKKHYK
jgi:hypothetical protein